MVGPAGKAACGGGLEATVRGRDYPVKTDHVSLGVTILSVDQDMVIGASLESEFRLTHDTRLSVSGNLSNRNLGKICIRISSSQHMEIALIAPFLGASFVEGLLLISQTATRDMDEDLRICRMGTWLQRNGKILAIEG